MQCRIRLGSGYRDRARTETPTRYHQWMISGIVGRPACASAISGIICAHTDLTTEVHTDTAVQAKEGVDREAEVAVEVEGRLRLRLGRGRVSRLMFCFISRTSKQVATPWTRITRASIDSGFDVIQAVGYLNGLARIEQTATRT